MKTLLFLRFFLGMMMTLAGTGALFFLAMLKLIEIHGDKGFNIAIVLLLVTVIGNAMFWSSVAKNEM